MRTVRYVRSTSAGSRVAISGRPDRGEMPRALDTCRRSTGSPGRRSVTARATPAPATARRGRPTWRLATRDRLPRPRRRTWTALPRQLTFHQVTFHKKVRVRYFLRPVTGVRPTEARSFRASPRCRMCPRMGPLPHTATPDGKRYSPAGKRAAQQRRGAKRCQKLEVLCTSDLDLTGALGGIRTPNLLIRSRALPVLPLRPRP